MPIDHAWAVLTDVELVAPCLPGAELQGRDGESYLGRIRVKLGPVVAQYRGKASIVERDEERRRMVMRAEGRDARGQGNVKATIQAELEEIEGGTHVRVLTDLGVTGRVAQVGRGLLSDVSAKIVDQFVENLERGPLGEQKAPVASEPVSLAAIAPGSRPLWIVLSLVGLGLGAALIWYFSR